MDELSILLVEDDQIACEEIRNCIDSVDDMHLIGITGNMNEALELVRYSLPDIILLDLELHRGGGNGLLFLQKLKQIQLSVEPFILITTNNTSQTTFTAARQLGADFIVTKYESGYSPQYLVDFLHIMKDTILMQRHSASDFKQALSSDRLEENLVKRIQRELNLVGISPKAVGFQYLVDAIFLIIQNSTPNISRKISEKYGKTEASIERAMQNAINRAWQTNDPDDLLKYYTARVRSDRGVPTLMEFVHYYASQLKS